MKCLNLHSWELEYNEAVAVQRELRNRLILEPPELDLRLVAGADVSYSRGSDLFFASVVVLEMPGMNIVEEKN